MLYDCIILIRNELTMNKLKEVRERLGLSQDELADILSCRQPKISRMESGARKISLYDAEKIRKLAEVKGFTFDVCDLINNRYQPSDDFFTIKKEPTS